MNTERLSALVLAGSLVLPSCTPDNQPVAETHPTASSTPLTSNSEQSPVQDTTTKERKASACDKKRNRGKTVEVPAGKISAIPGTPEHPTILVLNDTNSESRTYEVKVKSAHGKNREWETFNKGKKHATVLLTSADIKLDTRGRRGAWTLQCMDGSERGPQEFNSRTQDTRTNYTPKTVLGLEVLSGGQEYKKTIFDAQTKDYNAYQLLEKTASKRLG